MFRFIVLSCAVAACLGQVVDDKDAKILKEQRFNNGDGRAGAAFATENEIVFREESDASGNRIGQYSYIGEDGKTYTVKYTAGKDGFRIIEGAHIPSDGQGAAAFVAEEPAIPAAPREAPAEAIAALPAAPIIEAAPAVPDYEYDDAPVDPNFNPFINPHDPTHRNFLFNANAAKFAPKVEGARDASVVPNCADCQGVNPFINPFDQSHQAGLLAGHLAGHQAGVIPNARPTGRVVRPAAPAARPAAARPQPQLSLLTTTPAPKRFFPPGQLSLNRFETGFNFDFSS